jgi:uncharacterized integral membrane protein
MKRALQWLTLVPLAVVGIAFAVANRHSVGIYFDPFVSAPSEPIGVKVPLFVVLILALALGVLLGGFFTWLRQGKHRRALREARGETARARGEAERIKREISG